MNQLFRDLVNALNLGAGRLNRSARRAALSLWLVAAIVPGRALGDCPPMPCDDGSHQCRVGLVSNDEIWEADEGPYLITGDLTIRPWATLTIRAGTEVRVSTCDEQGAGDDVDRIEIIALGTLQVQGTAEEPIVFRSHAAAPSPGHWRGIMIRTEPGAGNAGASSIRRAHISAAVSGITSESDLPTAIEGNLIESCLVDGVTWSSVVSPTIVGNLIQDNGGDGIRLTNTSDDLYGANIVRNTLYRNGRYGLEVGSDITVTLARNDFRNNVDGGVLLGDRTSGSVRNNVIAGNGGHGLAATRSQNTLVTLAHNTIYSNLGDGAHFTGELTPNATVLRANIVATNRDAGIRVPADSQPLLLANDVAGNGSDYVEIQPDPASMSANPIFVDVLAAREDAHQWDLRITGSSPCIDRAPPDGAPEVDFFGEARGFDGDFDGQEGPDLGAFEYLLTTPPRVGSGLLGNLNIDSVWLAEEGPYEIVGDLRIPPHVTLFVQPGTEVRFASQDGMSAGIDSQRVELIVEGRIEVTGNKVEPIVFHGTQPEIGGWHGVRFVGQVGGSTVTDTIIRHARMAISVESSSTVRPIIQENTFTDFELSGIAWTSPVSPDVRGNEFSGAGQAIVVNADGASVPSSPRIADNTVDGCATAIYLKFTGVATVARNSITHCNGGVFVDPTEQATARIVENIIGQDEHEQTYTSPGILVSGPASAEISRNAVYGHAIGIDVREQASADLVNNVVYGNWGDGVYLRGASAERPSLILHGTVAFNGRGIHLGAVEQSGLVTIANSIVVNNVAGGIHVDGAFEPALSANDVWSNGSDNYVGVEPDGASLSENPRFIGDTIIRIEPDPVARVPYSRRVSSDTSRDVEHLHPNPSANAGSIDLRFHFSELDIEGCCDRLRVYDCDGGLVSSEQYDDSVEWLSPWWPLGACRQFRFNLDVDHSVRSTYAIDWYEVRVNRAPSWDTRQLNLRLQPNSGLIESADPEFETDEDFLGELRPYFPFGENQDNARPDIGAFEFRQNLEPVAVAGDDVVIEPGETVRFDGSASFDPDGELVSYRWRFGPEDTLDEAIVERTYPEVGEHQVTLTVTDDDGAESTDTLNVTVRVRPPNVPPVAEAGANRNGFIGIPITFDGRASTDEDGQIVGYTWNFGDGQRAEGAVVSHFYAALGSYTVTLTVTDDREGQGSDTTEVEIVPGVINRPPVADPSGPVAGDEGVPIDFDGSASSDADGAVVGWAWTFGDGASDEGEYVVHTYVAPGEYEASLTVTDDDGATHVEAFTVFVNARPVADGGTNRVAVQGEPINFDGSSSQDPDGEIVEWRWDFGDGQHGRGVEVQHAYGDVGDYVVQLAVTDDDGARSEDQIFVEILASDNQAPVAAAGGNRSAIVGEAVAFDGSASEDPDGEIVTFHWSFGDGSAADTSVAEHAYAVAGEFTVTLTVTDNEGSIDTDQITIAVRNRNQPPTADAGADIEAELGAMVRFDGSGSFDPDGEIVEYRWDFGDDNAATGAQVSHIYAAAGEYAVRLTVVDESGTEISDSITVTIFAPNEPPLAEAGEEVTGEAGVLVAFDGSASRDPDGQIVEYVWALGDGTLRQGVRVEHLYAQAGDYLVTLTVTDEHGATSNDTTTAHIAARNLPPTAEAGDDFDIFVGEAASFDGNGSSDADGVIVDYVWGFGDGSPDVQGPLAQHAFDAPGQYLVTLTVTDDDGATDRDSVRVRVRPEDTPDNRAPEANAGGDRQVLAGAPVPFDGSESNDPDGIIVSYVWDFGDGTGAEGQAAVHAYDTPGLYVVNLTVTDDAGAFDIDTAIVSVTAPNEPPTAQAGEDQTVEIDQPVAFDGSASADPDGRIVLFDWNFGDGTTARGETVVHPYAQAGIFVATLTVTDDAGATDSDSAVITVTDPGVDNEPPTADAGRDVAGAPGQEIDFDGSASRDADGEIVSYEWDFGDGSTAQGVQVTHVYVDPDEYLVTLTVTDNHGAVNRDTRVVTIEELVENQPPVADAGEDLTVQRGRPAVFDGSGSVDADGEVVGYAWDFGDGGAGAGVVASHTYDQGGVFTVTLTVTDDAGATARDTARVDVNLPPISVIEGPAASRVGEEVLLSAGGSEDPDGEIVEYAWAFGDGEIAAGDLVRHVYQVEGVYRVTLTVTDNQDATARSEMTIRVGPAIVEPDAAVVEPDAAVVEPDAAVVEPDAAIVEPDAAIVEPDAAIVEADAGIVEPDAAIVEAPDAEPSEPDARAEADVAVHIGDPDAATTPDSGGPIAPTADGTVSPPSTPEEEGCACRVPGRESGSAWLAWLLLLAVPVLRRRRARSPVIF